MSYAGCIRSASVYAEQLASKGRGIPMWYPEPSGSGEVEIGDIGFLHNGGFHRLFNVTVGRDHPFNVDGVPDNFVPLPGGRRFHDHRAEDLPPCVLSSSSVGCTQLQGHLEGQAVFLLHWRDDLYLMYLIGPAWVEVLA